MVNSQEKGILGSIEVRLVQVLELRSQQRARALALNRDKSIV
jgi:hypothetical protein